MTDRMELGNDHLKYADRISKAEFIRLFPTTEAIGDWFNDEELKAFSFPRNSGSLGARYLIKKRICDYLNRMELRKDIRILNEDGGKPVIAFGNGMRDHLDRAGIRQVLCSVSHSRNYIAAMTIFCF
jgi:phosphopantetheinyl transferase (holo-ACP synthase)